MAFLLFAIFAAVPIIEITLFITVGQQIGLWYTLGLVILTAILGTALLQSQGLAAYARTQAQLRTGEMPVEEVTTGFFLLIAGAFLLTPGFFTDALGFALFVPAVRRYIGRRVLDWIMKNGSVHVHTTGFGTHPGSRPRSGNGTIDGDFEDVTPEDADPNHNPRSLR